MKQARPFSKKLAPPIFSKYSGTFMFMREAFNLILRIPISGQSSRMRDAGDGRHF